MMIDSRISPNLRGVALGVALLKPSFALPFFFLPLVRREWMVVITATCVQLIGLGFVIGQIGGGIDLFRDWLTVGSYFLGGVYTAQDLVTVLGGRFPWFGPGLTLFFSLVLLGTMTARRQLPVTQLFSLTAITSVFWIYHGD